ncbi:MAG: TIGR03118 family protein, partial [Ginsengibacter sp.]
MKQNFKKNKLFYRVTVALFLTSFLFLSGCKKNPSNPLKDFKQVNVVANDDKYHPLVTDENFINGWGLSFSPSGIIWASAEGTGLSEIWRNDGSAVFPAVTIPGATDDAMGGHPSGQVFNSSTDFVLPNGNPARFIFAGLDGIISGWNGGPAAAAAINNSKRGDVYTGLALASMEGSNYLYAANF